MKRRDLYRFSAVRLPRGRLRRARSKRSACGWSEF
jgi:hypothetical protein